MTTTDEPTEAPAELGQLLDLIAASGDQDQGDGPPAPAVAGTFAMYPGGNGGIVIVMDIHEGPMAGVHKAAIPPALIRTAMALTGQSGGIVGRLAARRNRKAIDGQRG